jgi:glycosyltransferase involved in cell wall biosynthesis
LRILNIGRLLKKIGKVSLVIAPYFPIDEQGFARTREEFELKRIIQLTRDRSRNLADRIRHEFDPLFLKTSNLKVSESDRSAMLRMIEEHDVVWVHSLHTANAFQIFEWPHSVLDIDDIPSQFFTSCARSGLRTIRRLLDYRLSIIWKRRERYLSKRFNIISVVSDDDRKYLGGGRQIRVVPNGFSAPLSQIERTPSEPPRIGYIGTFKYAPNREGVEWFIKTVWPMVKKDIPSVRLRLIGEDGDKLFGGRSGDIDALGWVEDPGQEIASWALMIVPVLSGAGTRIKLAEAFSRKCPVVSTSLGAFGYNVIDREDLLLANDAKDFALSCVSLLENRAMGSKLVENAWGKFLQNWTWESIGSSVFKAVEKCLN